MWVNIVAKLPLRTVAVLGDAIRIPTVIDVLEYEDLKRKRTVVCPTGRPLTKITTSGRRLCWPSMTVNWFTATQSLASGSSKSTRRTTSTASPRGWKWSAS